MARVARIELTEIEGDCLLTIIKKGSDWREREDEGRDEAGNLYIEVAIQGTKGERFPNIPQEESTRFRIVGFSSDPSRNVEISLIDSGLDDEGLSISGPGGLTPSNAAQLGRFRNTWPAKDDARAVRRDVRAQIVDPGNPSPVEVLQNGLTVGKYEASIAEYIYSEVTRFGARSNNNVNSFAVPVAFENFCCLRKAGTIITALDQHELKGLDPFPESGHPRSQLTGFPEVRVCGD